MRKICFTSRQKHLHASTHLSHWEKKISVQDVDTDSPVVGPEIIRFDQCIMISLRQTRSRLANLHSIA